MVNTAEEIKTLIQDNDVVLFMKGSPDFPMCGFSATVVNILQQLNANFKSIDVLGSEEMRQGIKDYTDWPTIPQLYINNEFVGGCDIVREMYEAEELQELLGVKE